MVNWYVFFFVSMFVKRLDLRRSWIYSGELHSKQAGTINTAASNCARRACTCAFRLHRPRRWNITACYKCRRGQTTSAGPADSALLQCSRGSSMFLISFKQMVPVKPSRAETIPEIGIYAILSFLFFLLCFSTTGDWEAKKKSHKREGWMLKENLSQPWTKDTCICFFI